MENENTPVTSGRYYTLKVKKIAGRICHLENGTGTIPLPVAELPDQTRRGDEVEVFLFMDGRDGLKATTRKPHAVLGDFAALEVKSVTEFGVFLDWGIKKDLFVPKKMLRTELKEGETAIVNLIPDFDGIGVIGTCRFDDFFEEDTSSLKENQEAELLIFGFTETGIRVILNNRWRGLLYRNEVFEELKIGDRRTGYIKKIRPDGLIDAALRKQGFREASGDARDILLQALKDAEGFLPLHDKSSPEQIRSILKISKKMFKQAVGGLYRDKIISLEETGIRLIKK